MAEPLLAAYLETAAERLEDPAALIELREGFRGRAREPEAEPPESSADRRERLARRHADELHRLAEDAEVPARLRALLAAPPHEERLARLERLAGLTWRQASPARRRALQRGARRVLARYPVTAALEPGLLLPLADPDRAVTRRALSARECAEFGQFACLLAAIVAAAAMAAGVRSVYLHTLSALGS